MTGHQQLSKLLDIYHLILPSYTGKKPVTDNDRYYMEQVHLPTNLYTLKSDHPFM